MSNSIKEQLAKPIKPSDFYIILCNHDWFYNHSDDGRVWRAGQAMEKCIVSCALRSEFANFMYCKFVDARKEAILSGKQFTKPTIEELVKGFPLTPPWK